MHSRALIVLFLVASLVLPLSPAALAGTADDPELRDPCGPVEDVTTYGVPEPSPPWADICSVWFDTLTGESGAPALQVNLELAGPLAERQRPSSYSVAWQVGDDCVFRVHRADAGGPQLRSMARELTFRCGPTSKPAPCDPPLPTECTEAIPPLSVPLPAEVFSEDGNVLRITLLFDGALADLAPYAQAGTVLTRLSAHANGTGAQGATSCVSGFCSTMGSDGARYGRDYTVEPGSGPAVTSPLVTPPTPCVDSAIADATSERMHATDPADDHWGVVGVTAVEDAGYDVRGAWFGPGDGDGDDVTLNLLPAGPAANIAETGYRVEFEGVAVTVNGQPDGSWAATHGTLREVGGLYLRENVAETTVRVDATSGLVTVDLPAALLPEGVVRLDNFSSHFIYGGAAPRLGPDMVTTTGVDHSTNAQICDALR